jgi:hypothetical protein
VKKIELNLLNSKSLIDFIVKFRVLDKNILLEISNDKLIAKTFKDELNIMKYGTIEFDDIFAYSKKNDKIDETIKLWVYNIDKFKAALLAVGDCKFIISYDETDMSATQIELKTKNIKKIIKVLNNLEFNEIEDNKIENLFDIKNSFANIYLDKEFLFKLKQLTDLEVEGSFVISTENSKVTFIGSEFELNFDGEFKILNNEIKKFIINRSIFKFIDNEDYNVYLKENAILFFDSNNFKLASGLLESQDDFE